MGHNAYEVHMPYLRRLFTSISAFLIASMLWAGPIAISFGHSALSFDPYCANSLEAMAGVSACLGDRMELNLGLSVQLTPRPFSDIQVQAELALNLTGKNVRPNSAGDNISVMAALGVIASDHNPQGLFLPTTITLRLYPAVVGSPLSARRERLIPIGVAYNLMTRQFALYWSFIIYDHYIVTR